MAVGTRQTEITLFDPLESPVLEAEIYRFNVDQYHRMIEQAILPEGERFELLEGILVKSMTKKPPHAVATGLVSDALTAALPDGWHVSVQDPVTTTESEPEPDLKVVRGQRRDYVDRHPGSADVGLIVEVADTSLLTDRGIKKRIYARAGVPFYWVLNLLERRLEVFSDPTPSEVIPGFRGRQEYHPGESVALSLDGRDVGRIAVNDLLP